MTVAARDKTLAEREITITRVFDAPRATVFRAWTDANQLAQWWGPKGFTNPVCEIEARVGEAIRIHMRSPDGSVYPDEGRSPRDRAARAACFYQHCRRCGGQIHHRRADDGPLFRT